MPSKIPSIRTRCFSTEPVRSTINTKSRHVTSRTLCRSAFSVSGNPSYQIPTFLLPFRAKLHQAASKQSEVTTSSQFQNTEPRIPPSVLQRSQSQKQVASEEQSHGLGQPQNDAKPLVISKSMQELLPSLCAQHPHYISAHIHRFPYLVTEGDTIRLPFHLHGVSPGDILRFNRASILGSRDYTLKAGAHSTETYDKKRTGEPNYIDERLFECRVRVMGLDSGPMMIKEKTKRRNRRVKTVRSKHKYTVVKVMEIRVKTMDELKGDKGVLLLE